MTKTWILAAHRGGAKFYEHTAHGALALVSDIDHPRGRLRNHEIDSDGGGSKSNQGSHRDATGRENDATTQEALTFARTLAGKLSEARHQRAFERLILVAEPRFLGILRAELDAPTAALVTGSVNHELTDASEAQLREHVQGLLGV